MLTSTEQVLHPYRYGRGDVPVTLAFDQPDGALYEDVFGEFDIRVLNAELSKTAEVTTPIAIGWGGDRFRVYDPGWRRTGVVHRVGRPALTHPLRDLDRRTTSEKRPSATAWRRRSPRLTASPESVSSWPGSLTDGTTDRPRGQPAPASAQ
jgi:hypothetical protein